MKLVAIALCPTFAGFLHRLYFILFCLLGERLD